MRPAGHPRRHPSHTRREPHCLGSGADAGSRIDGRRRRRVPATRAAGGGSGGNAGSGGGTGIVDPVFPDPGEPQPTLVAPGVGLTGIHPVGATKLDTAINGRDLAVRVSWYGGVEPCSVLAGVDVARDGNTFTLTVREGSAAAPDTACIEIAMYKGTIVDLGELEPGTYTITAFGDAPPVTVTID